MQLKFDYSKALGFVNESEITYFDNFIKCAHEMLHNKTGQGNDFLGWVDLPVNYDKDEFSKIKATAEKIKGDSDILLVIGIGGSYLGARAAIDLLSHSFYNNLPKSKEKLQKYILSEII